MAAKRLSRVRGSLVAAALCAACVLLAAETQETLITFKAGALLPSLNPYPDFSRVSAPPGTNREFIVDVDGSVVLFAEKVFRWREGKWRQAENIQPEGVVYDAVPSPDGKWFIVSMRSPQEAILYQYDDMRLMQVAVISGRFQDGMILRLAPDGTVWIATQGTTVYGVKDGKTIVHELAPGVSSSSQSLSGGSSAGVPPLPVFSFGSPGRVISPVIFPRILSLMPGRGIWFWPYADYRANRATESLAIKGFQVYDDGQWRTVSHSGRLLGGVAPIDSNTILCASRYKGMFSVSTVDGSIKDVNWTLPDKESCVFLHRTPSQRILAITAEPIASSQLARNAEGAFGKLVVFENGRAKVLLDGMDYGEGSFDKGRPAVDTAQGTFIATVGGGIVFVPTDASQARRFDSRANVPILNADRMRVRGDRLYLLDRAKGLAVMDWTKLLHATESAGMKDRWRVYQISAAPAVAKDGSIWWLDAGKTPERLNCWRDGNLTQVSSEAFQFSSTLIRSIAADIKGGIWLLPQSSAIPAACFNHGKWRTFSRADIAWSSVAIEEKENPGFRFIGNCTACPVFGNGRAAYWDPSSRGIRYFDGAAWQTINSPLPNGSVGGNESLSIEDGVLTIRYGSGCFQFIEGQWQLQSEQAARGRVAPPLSDRSAKYVPPESFPGDKGRCSISLKDAVDLTWAGNPEELYRGLEDVWVRFPTIGTPLFAAENIPDVLMDGSGDLWFVLQNGPSTQLAHYRGVGKTPTLEWRKPPASLIKTAKTVFSCRVLQSMEGRTLLRYRIDGGSWRKTSLTDPRPEIVVENLPNGMHQVEMRAFDALLRSSQPLTAAFEVKRDYQAEIKDLISQLNIPHKREDAARAMVSIGSPAVPMLTAQKEKADSEIRWWLQAVLDEIGRNEKGYKD
jgi:hypothetical protein